MRNPITGLMAGFLALAAPVAAQAQNVVPEPKVVAKVMQEGGYRAELQYLSNGAPYIQSGAGGHNFRVFFYGCDDDFSGCKWVQLYAGFLTDTAPTLEQMNAYISENEFARIYIDQEGDPVIEMDIDLEDGGMSPELFKDNLEYWEYFLSKFAEFVASHDT